MKKINVGVIGLGYWGPNLVRNFSANPKSVVKYASDLIPTHLKKIKAMYPNIITTNNYKDMLNDKDVMLVCIATPPATHYHIAKECILAGKHVLIEKPMTTKVKDAKELIELAEKKKVKIFVDHTFVFSPPVIKMKEMIEKGEIGAPLYFDSERINLGLFQKDVNVVWDLAIHDFSILNYLFPKFKPSYISATGSKHKHPYLEDLAHVIIKYANGFIAHIHVSWLSPVKIRKTIIGGSKRMIWYDDVHPFEKIKVYDKRVEIKSSEDNPFFPTYVSGDIRIPKLENMEPLGLEAQHIIECLLNNKSPFVSGKEGLEVVSLLNACDLSLRRDEEVKVGDTE